MITGLAQWYKQPLVDIRKYKARLAELQRCIMQFTEQAHANGINPDFSNSIDARNLAIRIMEDTKWT